MAEAGPSSPPSNASSSQRILPSNSKPSARVLFPHENTDAANGSFRRSDAASRMSIGLGRPPISRRLTHADSYSSRDSPDDPRPRVKSVDATAPLTGPSRSSYRALELGLDAPSRRVTPTRRNGRKDKGRAIEHPEIAESFSTATFSEEYDLAHEDPGILEDVQRALKLKARREARVKATQAVQKRRDITPLSDFTSASSMSPRSSPVRTSHSQITPQSTLTAESEIDFSPSISIVPIHPVPLSSDGGITLDWSNPMSEDERVDRRWSISIKRKSRDRHSIPVRNVVEKQEAVYADKLSHIKEKAKPNTLRKAALTSSQLSRQYSAIFNPLNEQNKALNLLDVARWYNCQDAVVRSSLDKTEPLTWLKHLLDKRTGRPDIRSPWYISAITMEEYLRYKLHPDAMETIPEDSAVDSIGPKASPVSASMMYPENRSPSEESWSWTSPRQSLEPSLSRKKPEEIVSFEPSVDSGRNSLGRDSRFSLDVPQRNRAVSGPDGTNSPRSSMHSSMLPSSWTPGISPNSSRANFREFAKRMRRKQYAASEEGLSSGRNSISERSQDEDRPVSRTSQKSFQGPITRKSKPKPLAMSLSEADTDGEKPPISREPSEIGDPPNDEVPRTAKQASLPYSTSSNDVSVIAQPDPSKKPSLQVAPPRLGRRRASLPSPHQFFKEEKVRQEADEEKESLEYEHKQQLLEETLQQNFRTRQVLQRVGANIREYESIQSNLAHLLGIPYRKIPHEVLDSLSHDPSSVVSATKRFRGYKAVDDIHERINRQRDILRAFASSISGQEVAPPAQNVFDDSITSLMQALEQLEIHRQHIAREAADVAEALAKVKPMHAVVKKEYNETLGHTSLVYTQISQIVALEENYRNHYQQFWNIGLDALTLILDSVTPFWRIYGKVIGDDVQDFLIIPWYRNEFTGESKRYPILRLPRRSFRHWIGLLVFSFTSCIVTILQVRGAISSTINYNLPWITHTGFRWLFTPFFIGGIVLQWCAVLFECSIVIAECGIMIWWLGWAIKLFD
ncbi:hypothetical protein ABKN59_000713 [Abortiporus biennis]